MAITIDTNLEDGIFAVGNPIAIKFLNNDGLFNQASDVSPEWNESWQGKTVVSNADQVGGSFVSVFSVGMTLGFAGVHLIGEYEILGILSQFDVMVIDCDWNELYENDFGIITLVSDPAVTYVETEIYKDAVKIATSYNSRLANYIIKVDFSNFLKVLFNPTNESRYLYLNYIDVNLSSYFKFRYREHRVGIDYDPVNSFTEFSDNIYVVYAAKQILTHGGGNLRHFSIDYLGVGGTDSYRKFLTKFERPKFFRNFPFDVSFLWWSDIAQPEVVLRMYRADYLNDLTFTQSDYNLENNLGYGLHRCWIRDPNDSRTKSINLKLQAQSMNSWVDCINELPVDYDASCYENPIYLCWINTDGGIDYWLFHTTNYDVLNVSGTTIAKKYISDWEEQNTQKDIATRSAYRSLIIGADNLDSQQIRGISDICYSKKVMMLKNAQEFMNDRSGANVPHSPTWTYTSAAQSYGIMTALINQNTSPEGYTVGQFIQVDGDLINGIFEILIITDPGVFPAGIVIRLAWSDDYATDNGGTMPVVYNIDPVWETVIVREDTFKLLDARSQKGSIELEIELSDINIQ